MLYLENLQVLSKKTRHARLELLPVSVFCHVISKYGGCVNLVLKRWKLGLNSCSKFRKHQLEDRCLNPSKSLTKFNYVIYLALILFSTRSCPLELYASVLVSYGAQLKRATFKHFTLNSEGVLLRQVLSACPNAQSEENELCLGDPDAKLRKICHFWPRGKDTRQLLSRPKIRQPSNFNWISRIF